MSLESRAAFCEKANQDQSLSDALWVAVQSSDSVQQIIQLAAQHGYQLSHEEAESVGVISASPESERELSESDLEAVAGGGFKIKAPGPFQKKVLAGVAIGAASGAASGGIVGAAVGGVAGGVKVVVDNHAHKRWGW